MKHGAERKNRSPYFTHGAVLKVEREYTREQIHAMLLAIKTAGINTVVIWPAVYWWEEGGDVYPYGTGHDILRYAGEIGLEIIMELAGQITSLEYAPDFLMKDEYYCVDQKGRPDMKGPAYGYLNFNHPDVMTLVHKQFSEIASQYMSYPALAGYDVWNETQFSSFDPYTLERFRKWLHEKYDDLSTLNDVWDRAYRDWEQVRFTSWLWASVMPFVDYNEFCKDNIAMILQDMKKSIRAIDKRTPILADNVHATVAMDQHYSRPSDDWAVARNVDRYGISFYPKFMKMQMPPYMRHQNMVGAHSASPDGVFSISEMQTHYTSIFSPESYVQQGDLWQWCWEAISHGAKGIIYWKWNPFVKGIQTFGRGLVDHKGRSTPRLELVQRFWRVLEAEPEIITAMPTVPSAAILYDRLNHDFSKAYTVGYNGTLGVTDSVYIYSIMGLYQTLWQANVPSRFVIPDQLSDLDPAVHPVLFVTTQLAMGETMSKALSDYMKKGGLCVFDGKLAEVNEHGLLNDIIPGAGIAQNLGFELLDYEGGDLAFTLQMGEETLSLQGVHDRRQIEPGSAQVIGAYTDGTPAALKNSHGKGGMVYLSTFFWLANARQVSPGAIKFIVSLLGSLGLQTAVCTKGELHLERLDSENCSLMFAFNYGTQSQEAEFSIKSPGRTVTELIRHEAAPCTIHNGTVHFVYTVGAGDVAVFKVGVHD
ncbi:MAG: beta-galactosidase [Treponema sp.]|jgi:beta-galactosidase GanA|nr:beta-galactosidase [Treponema sp.]